jgi:FG-GAP repeat
MSFFRSHKSQCSNKRRLLLERLEDRTLPATNITILSSGVGTLDHFLSASNGTVTVTDDPGDLAATLSAAALQSVGSGVPISISADNQISLNDLGTLSLLTGTGIDAAFHTTSGPITFANTSNTVATAGGNIAFSAGTDLMICSLNSNGGSISLKAGGNVSLPSNSTVEATGNTVSILIGLANAAGGTANVAGTIIATNGSVQGGPGPNVFNINPAASPDLTATGGDGRDTFNITPNATAIVTVHGGLPDPPANPGDSLNVILAGTTNPQLSATRTPMGYRGSGTFGNRASVSFDGIETLIQEKRVAASTTQDGTPNVIVRDAAGNQIANFYAFNPGPGMSDHQLMALPVSVAVGDVNGDGVPDIIVAPSQFAVQAEVKIIDGTSLNMVDANGVIESGALLADFFAYDPRFLGGAYVAFGLSGSLPEIITGAGPGGGPHVKVIDGTKLSQLHANGEIADSALIAQFYAYDPRFGGGVSVAAADLNGDGVLDIVTGAGPVGGPHVKAIDGTKIQVTDLQNDSEPATATLLGQFYAYALTYSGGVFVAVSTVGMHPIIVTGTEGSEFNIGPNVKVIDATQLSMLDNNSEPTGSALLAAFFAFAPRNVTDGAAVAAADINSDGVADIIVGGLGTVGLTPTPEVKVIDGTKLADLQPNGEIADTALHDSFFFQFASETNGVFVGAQ